jgi:hypothetical protein
MGSPPTHTRLYDVVHEHVPLFINRQVLVNAAPGANAAPSGTVISDTNCAESHWVAASACGTVCVMNNVTKMIVLRKVRLCMGPLADSSSKNGLFLDVSKSVYAKSISIVAPIAAFYIRIFILKPDNFDAIFDKPGHRSIIEK